MKRVGMYIWDHLRGRHHIGRSLVNAAVAYVGVMAIPLTLTYLFLQPLNWYLIAEAASIARISLIWGVVGVVCSAVRTLNTRAPNRAAKLLSVGALLLLVAVLLLAVVLDVRRFVG